MQPFAATFARNGYTAITFDLAGHGRNPNPLTGSITNENGATQTLVAETTAIAAYARTIGDGRLAILGHSMASDIVIRTAQAMPDIAATIAVSMFSPAVTATSPRNLLIIAGDWEGALKREALRAISLLATPASEAVTYGAFANGSARRAAFSPGVEHIAVLYSRASMQEALSWLDQTFEIPPNPTPYLDARGPWIALLLAGIVTLARPLARLLPVAASRPIGANLPWRRLWPLILGPAIATPLILLVLPTHFLPVLVGDYLAAHFALYGLLTIAGLAWIRKGQGPQHPQTRWPNLLIATLAVTLYAVAALFWALDTHVTSFTPTAARLPLILAMLAGTLCYFLAEEWLTRGPNPARFAAAASKTAFLLSLAAAIALDFHRLFFLIIIIPIILLFFIVYGLFSAWTYRRTAHPLVAATATAIAFAWAIGVTFPMLAG